MNNRNWEAMARLSFSVQTLRSGLCIALVSWIAILTYSLPRLEAQAGPRKIASRPAVESNGSASEPIAIACEARIERHLGSDSIYYMVAEIDLPALEAAKKYKLNISLVNPYDMPITFSKISVDCGCAKFEAETNEIAALSKSEFKMHLDVPNRTSSGAARTMASFFAEGSDTKPTLRLQVTYTVNGGFGFGQSRAIVEFPKTESVVVAKLPIILVPPMTLDNLELNVSENLRDLTIELIGDDRDSELPYIQIEAARQAIPRHGLTGEVFLRRSGTDHVSGVVVSFKHQESFTIRPESLRLSRDNHSNPYEATAMLRVHSPVGAIQEPEQRVSQVGGAKKEGGSREVAAPPQVSLSIGGTPARVLVQKLGQSGIYRLTIRHDGPLDVDSDGTLEVRWKVILSGEEQAIASHAFLPDR